MASEEISDDGRCAHGDMTCDYCVEAWSHRDRAQLAEIATLKEQLRAMTEDRDLWRNHNEEAGECPSCDVMADLSDCFDVDLPRLEWPVVIRETRDELRRAEANVRELLAVLKATIDDYIVHGAKGHPTPAVVARAMDLAYPDDALSATSDHGGEKE